jgi:hypothetical protein
MTPVAILRAFSLAIAIAVAAFVLPRTAHGQLINVSGSPPTLRITTATAGGSPNPVTDASTTYTVFSLRTNQKITAHLNQAMPPGTSLLVTLAAPNGSATTKGAVTLTTTAQDMVTGIGFVLGGSHPITYEFTATSAAGVIATDSRVVTLTMLTGP